MRLPKDPTKVARRHMFFLASNLIGIAVVGMFVKVPLGFGYFGIILLALLIWESHKHRKLVWG